MISNIVLDERASAEYAIENLSLGQKPIATLGRLARYYYQEGYGKGEIGGLLEDFLMKCDPTVNIVKWQAAIDRQVRVADKYQLIDIQGVPITKSELDRIASISGQRSSQAILLKRLMFTMLCLAKYWNAVNESNNNWVNVKDREVFSLANIAVTTKRQSLMLNDLWTMGLIGFSRMVDNININVKIVDDKSPQVLFISDFRNLGNQYRMYLGEKYVQCQCCGLTIRRESNSQRYCPECAIEVNRRKTFENCRRAASQ